MSSGTAAAPSPTTSLARTGRPTARPAPSAAPPPAPRYTHRPARTSGAASGPVPQRGRGVTVLVVGDAGAPASRAGLAARAVPADRPALRVLCIGPEQGPVVPRVRAATLASGRWAAGGTIRGTLGAWI